MTPDDLDRILSSEDPLEPSSGFARSVMAAIQDEAAAPAPARFPWLRFLAGLGSSGVMAASGTALLLRCEPLLRSLAPATPEIGYATAAILVSLGLLSLPRLLARL